MRRKRWSITTTTTLGLMLVAASVGKAIESTSETFVATATTIQGTGGGSARVSYFALQMVRPVVHAGTITALGAGTLRDAAANWRAGQFHQTNGAFYVEFDSGLMADIVSADTATQTLTLDGALPGSVAVGHAYRIRKHFTLADIFGPSNEAGLQSGPNKGQADNVILRIPQTQEARSYFYSNVPGYSGWYGDDLAPAGDTVIFPEQGLMVRRKRADNVTLVLNGLTKDGPVQTPVFPGYNLVGTLKSVRSLRLADLNLYSGNAATGLAAGSNAGMADNVILIHPDSTTTTYFYSDYPGYVGWWDIGLRPANDVLVPAGSAFFIHRKTPRGLFYWANPAE